MNFTEITNEICERLNYTSADARSRVGREINDRYKRLTSGIGLETSRRVSISANAVVGNRTMTFATLEKVLSIINKAVLPQKILTELTKDEIDILPVRDEPPRNYAVTRMHNNSVDIYLDCVPATTFTLFADGYTNLSTLSGTDTPDFPESFHDILVFGVMADEYRKMEKVPYAQTCESDYERRLSDLRMFIAKSAYLDVVQGKDRPSKYSPWLTRLGTWN